MSGAANVLLQRQRYSGFERMPVAGKRRQGRAKGVLRDHDPYHGNVIIEIPQADRNGKGSASPADANAVAGGLLGEERGAVMDA